VSTSIFAKRKRKLEIRQGEKKTKRKRIIHPSLGSAAIEIVQKNKWLENDHIELANMLLQKQFPKMNGFQPPEFGQDLSFSPIRDSFIQILHVRKNHWITVAGVPPGTVHIYDSVYSTVSVDTKMQVASLMCSNESTIVFKIHRVQYQQGSDDCGVFAVAFATDLAFGNEPASVHYEQKSLRGHFLDCIRKSELIPFPKQEMKYRAPKKQRVTIHCLCRLPDNGEEMMAKCLKCRGWFHQSCEKIIADVFKSNIPWQCSKCTL
jgi:O6-methylguanine-DNA--protein-cysteine methyltransferase